jgi:5-methylcytosine-specific restriction protein A
MLMKSPRKNQRSPEGQAYQSLYKLNRWRLGRLRFLQQHPLCAYCMKQDRIKAASVVDHIRPHRGNATLFWSEANWQALCRECHDVAKARLERGLTQELDAQGWPLSVYPK